MELKRRKSALMEMGKLFGKIAVDENNEDTLSLIQGAKAHNSWFTEENIRLAFLSWAELLTESKINLWISDFDLERSKNKRVGIILAGNIPMVGLHDLLTVLVSGNIAVCKFSSKDNILMQYVVDQLIRCDKAFSEKIVINEKFKDIDAVIATGSDNSSRYFEYYFSNVPHIFRKNRSSVSILTGDESEKQLELLGKDIFSYFGLGCRNVTKLYLPKGYNFETFFSAIYKFNKVGEHNKYANNYDYNKSIYLLNKLELWENGFVLLKEDKSLFSPLAVIFYEYYDNLEDVRMKILDQLEDIQCIVGNTNLFETEVNFGQSQKPELWDYADGVNTLEFLNSLD